MNYHNTTHMVNAELLAAIESATKQNDRVMLIFRTKQRPMSPSEVHEIYQIWFDRCPIWSIRARMSGLSKSVYSREIENIRYIENMHSYEVDHKCIYKAELEKTDLPKRMGQYRMESVWQLVKIEPTWNQTKK